MPKQVDHQTRRQEIAEAVLRLAASQGLDAVSLRHVAAEAGVSMGRVQHYFGTKDELLLFAFHMISERAERRLAAALTPVPPDARSFLRAFLVELLPLTEPARAEAPALAAFLARAVVEPRLAATLRDGTERMTALIADRIGAASADPVRDAQTLLAILDGLTTELLLGQINPAAALAVLDGQFDRVFRGERHLPPT